MTTIGKDQPEGRRISPQRFVFGRSRNRHTNLAEETVADPDRRWEFRDHVDLPSEDRTVTADPWGHEERDESNVAISVMFYEELAAGKNRSDSRSVPGASPPPAQTGGQAEQLSDHVPRDTESDLSLPEWILTLEEVATESGEPETEDWSDLKEAEDDFAQTWDELRTGAEGDTETDAFHADDEPFEKPDNTFDSAEVDFDDVASDTLISNNPTFGDIFEVLEDDATTTLVSAEFHDPSDGDIGIYDFDAEARQALWDFDPDADETGLRRTREKAAAITALVDVVSRSEQAQVLAFLTELFDHLQHSATFRAIHRAAIRGLTKDLLYSMVALRHVWMERTEWWAGRYGRGFEVKRLSHGASALSWAQASRICRARQDYPPTAMIDEQWLDEWLCMSPGEPGFLSFPAYIDIRVKSLEANLLDEGLSQNERSSGYSELADDFGWYRRVPDQEGAVRFGFHVLNPYDDGPGTLRILLPKD